MSYKYGLIDGNYFLRRNFSSARRTGNLVKEGYQSLINSFLSTVYNYHSSIGFEVLIVAWDRSPYKKIEKISQYKQDRHYTSESDVLNIKSKMELATGDELVALKSKLNKTQYELDCESIFQHAKSSLMKHLGNSWIHQVYLLGYEADDIAYLLSKEVDSTNDRCVLISVDNDWMTFMNPNTDFYKESSRRGRGGIPILCKWIESNSKVIANELGLTLYEYGNLREIYTGGHNNVTAYNQNYKIKLPEFCKRLHEKDSTLPEYDKYAPYYEALNINNYDNTEVVNLLRIAMNNELPEDHHKSVKEYFSNLKLYWHINKYTNLNPKKININEEFLCI